MKKSPAAAAVLPGSQTRITNRAPVGAKNKVYKVREGLVFPKPRQLEPNSNLKKKVSFFSDHIGPF